MCSEVERDNPRSRQGQFTCCQPTWLKTRFNLDALYLVWSFSMVLVAAWLGSSQNWKLQWTRGVSKLIWNYQCFDPNRPGFGVEWECGDTPVRNSTHTLGAYRGPEGQGSLSFMGSVCLGPENNLTNEYLCSFKLTRRPQQAIEWIYRAFGANRNGEEFRVIPFKGINTAMARSDPLVELYSYRST